MQPDLIDQRLMELQDRAQGVDARAQAPLEKLSFVSKASSRGQPFTYYVAKC